VNVLYWFALGLAGFAALATLFVVVFMAWVTRKYLTTIARIFEEKPLFLNKKAPAIDVDVEETRFRTADGFMLAGSYVRTTLPQRRGVVLFCPEFGARRMTCLSCLPSTSATRAIPKRSPTTCPSSGLRTTKWPTSRRRSLI
jgi:hypothetical protein